MAGRRELAQKIGQSKVMKIQDAYNVIPVFVDAIKELLKEEGEVRLTDFCTFKIEVRDSHEARNPATGETFIVPDRCHPKCSFHTHYKETVKQYEV